MQSKKVGWVIGYVVKEIVIDTAITTDTVHRQTLKRKLHYQRQGEYYGRSSKIRETAYRQCTWTR